MPKSKHITKTETKKFLNAMVDGMTPKQRQALYDILGSKLVQTQKKGGGFNGFLEGLLGGSEPESEMEEEHGGGVAKKIGKVGHNVGGFVSSLFGGAQSQGKKQSKANKPQTERQKLVKEVMRKYGVSLPEASRYIKQQGLYMPKQSGGTRLYQGGERLYQ